MNVLLTCAGRRNYVVDYFRAALAPFGGKVFAANCHPGAAALISADRGFVVPSLYDPNYIDVLMEICRENEIQAIIPLFDLELPVLAQAREQLAAEGIWAVVSSPDVIDICNDKWETIGFLKKHGLQAPKTYLELDEVLNAVASGEVSFPLILKPRWGMGSIGLLEAEDENELRVLYTKTRHTIQRSYLATESRRAPEKAVLIQEKLGGQEYGLDVVSDLRGRYITTFAKKKLAMRSGETDGAVMVDEPPLRNLGEQIAARLGHVANLDVDVFRDMHGARVLEMNPRFGGGYPFSHLAGANLPAAIVAWLRGEVADPDCFQIEYGTTGFKGILPLRRESTPLDLTTVGRSKEYGTTEDCDPWSRWVGS